MLRIKTCVCGFVDNLNLEILTEKDMYKTTQFNVTTMLTGPKYLRFYKKKSFSLVQNQITARRSGYFVLYYSRVKTDFLFFKN